MRASRQRGTAAPPTNTPKNPMGRHVLFLAVLLASSAGVPPKAAGQQGGGGVRLVPEVGWYMPQRDLTYVSREPIGLAPGPAIGLRAEIRLPVRGIGIRGGFSWVGSDLTRPRVAEEPGCGEACPIIPGEVDRFGGAQVYLAVLDLAVQGPRIGFVQPYVVGGGGLKHYDFRQGDLSGEVAEAFREDDTAPTAHVGLGLAFHLGAHTVLLEAGDHVSRSFADAKQDDLAVTAGVRIRLP